MILPRPWRSQEEREQDRFEDGRQGAFARGMRQAASRDGLTPGDSWQPGPVPRPRQVRKRERALQSAREGLGPATDRARTMARATEQIRQDRAQRRAGRSR